MAARNDVWTVKLSNKLGECFFMKQDISRGSSRRLFIAKNPYLGNLWIYIFTMSQITNVVVIAIKNVCFSYEYILNLLSVKS